MVIRWRNNTKGHCIKAQRGKGKHYVCKLGEFDHGWRQCDL